MGLARSSYAALRSGIASFRVRPVFRAPWRSAALAAQVGPGDPHEAEASEDGAGDHHPIHVVTPFYRGYTPELSTAVWVGYRDANRPLLDVRGVRRVLGGTTPAEIWKE